MLHFFAVPVFHRILLKGFIGLTFQVVHQRLQRCLQVIAVWGLKFFLFRGRRSRTQGAGQRLWQGTKVQASGSQEMNDEEMRDEGT